MSLEKGDDDDDGRDDDVSRSGHGLVDGQTAGNMCLLSSDGSDDANGWGINRWAYDQSSHFKV